jgi:hypothetical protein
MSQFLVEDPRSCIGSAENAVMDNYGVLAAVWWNADTQGLSFCKNRHLALAPVELSDVLRQGSEVLSCDELVVASLERFQFVHILPLV